MVSYEKLDINEVIAMARSGDDVAFAEILERYTPLLMKLISSFTTQEGYRDEAFSEAAVALHKAVLSYKLGNKEVTFGLFARICVQRKLSDYFTSRTMREKMLDISIDKIEDTRTVESAESLLLFREKLQRYIALAKEILSEYEYRVFILYIQDYDTDAMCRALSKERKSVENAKARMLKHLRENSARFADILN